MYHRQRAHDDRVDQGEDGRVGTDPECQRDDDHERESRVSPEGAQRIQHILLNLTDDVRSVGCSLSLLIHDDTILTNDVDVTELAHCLPPGRIDGPSGGDQALRSHLEMERQLVVHLAGDVSASKWDAKDAAHRGDSGGHW
jgi:hypothetical protein